MKQIIFCLFALILSVNINAQDKDTKVVLITLDGLRWQELFSGADPLLVSNKEYVHDTTGLKNKFWKPTPKARREVLMPFVWNTISEMGQIHGNRELGSKVDLTNKMWFSYPGYNEILTGKADDARIDSNDKIPNPNTTILELANTNERYKNKVAAFGSWDVFPFIVNEERSGVPVNGGFEIAKGDNLSEREKFLNHLQPKIPSPWSTVRLDAFTHYYAIEHMKKNHSALTYIAYGETDDFAHDGNYEAYLKSAYNTDALLKNLYDFTQEDAFYKDNTLFIITTDHGRGTEPLETWKSHGEKIKGAGQVWMILFGKGISAKGEISTPEQLHSTQIAPTIIKALNFTKQPKSMTGKPLSLGEK